MPAEPLRRLTWDLPTIDDEDMWDELMACSPVDSGKYEDSFGDQPEPTQEHQGPDGTTALRATGPPPLRERSGGDEASSVTRTTSSSTTSAPRLLCVLNFDAVPCLKELQRRMDKARTDAFLALGTRDVLIRTRITGTARENPEDWYVEGPIQSDTDQGSGGGAAARPAAKTPEAASHARQGRRTREPAPAARAPEALTSKPAWGPVDNGDDEVFDSVFPRERANSSTFRSRTPSGTRAIEAAHRREGNSQSSKKGGSSRAVRLASWVRSLGRRRAAQVVPSDITEDAP